MYHKNIFNTIRKNFDIIFSEKPDNNIVFPENANIIIIKKIFKKIIGGLKIFIPFDIFFPGYNLVITDSFTPLRLNKKNRIFTIIHDLMSITERKNYSIQSQIYYFFAHKTYKRADKIITVSDNTKNDIIRLLHIEKSNIVVIPNASTFTVDRKSVEDYFLFIGEMRKNKNLKNIILGFIEYKKQSDNKTKLIVCGSKKYEYNNIYNLIYNSEYEKDIIFTGYITDNQKIEFFSKTKGLILLSDNEGFGTPVIEAITNNIPVLVSDIPIMYEVSDNMGIFINQKDIYAIANGFSVLAKYEINNAFIDVCQKLKERYSLSSFEESINEIL